ncbi:hypothetical protein [Gimesia algae]|uniref:Uncharacterized protein n=1 Tax=Gimesia algae TaxID=2527971 RepID=A0A517V8A5_9PLAN|nr:hypothetical protein [Gimesia algae]QDT89236.1 hypothetical protein Pan161_08630 [Gimesia algae]
MVNGQRVVVFDGLNETEEVLKAILEPRGCSVDRVRQRNSNDLNSNCEIPSIVVVHDDDLNESNTSQPGWNQVPKVVIGSVRKSKITSAGQTTRFLMQPFQYAELIDSIESLLQQSPASD